MASIAVSVFVAKSRGVYIVHKRQRFSLVTLQAILQVLGLALFLPPALFHQGLGRWRVGLELLCNQLIVPAKLEAG